MFPLRVTRTRRKLKSRKTDWKVTLPSGHMTYDSIVHPGEGSSSVALLKVSSRFFHHESFFSSIFWEFFS